MKKMKDRISKILREEGMTAAKFADEIGVQASSISHIISGRNKPSSDFLVKLLERFRGINAEWLMTGKGEMYKSDSSPRLQTSSTGIYTGENTLFSETKKDDNVIVDTVENTSIDESEAIKSDDKSTFEKLSTESDQIKTDKQERTVEKIVIFFSDKTFESYNPHK